MNRFAWLLALLLSTCITFAHDPDETYSSEQVQMALSYFDQQARSIQQVHQLSERLQLDGTTAIEPLSVSILSSSFSQQLPKGLQQKIRSSEERYQAFMFLQKAYFESMGDSQLFREMAISIADLEEFRSSAFFEFQNLKKEHHFAPTEAYHNLHLQSKMVDLSFQMLQAIRSGRKQDLTSSLLSLKKALQQQESKLGQIQNQQLKVNLTDINSQWKKIILYSRQFLHDEDIPKEMESFGRNYYYYNTRLLPLLNHPKAGIIHLFNQALSVHQADLLPRISKLPWFHVPEKYRGYHPAHIVVLMDASASMKGLEAVETFKKSFSSVLGNSRKDSRFSFISWGKEANIKVRQEKDPRSILNHLKNQSFEGEINDLQGLKAAYNMSPIMGYETHIILLTDGGFDIDPTLVQLIEDQAYQGSYLHVAYTGLEDKKFRMKNLSQSGKGQFWSTRKGENNIRKLLPTGKAE
ncbi:MAG: vWA domain-containing protein [Bacteroidota bacterium]